MKGARIFVPMALAFVLAFGGLLALDTPSNAANTADARIAPHGQLIARVSMTVDAGFNSYFKDRAWVPLRITLVNTGDPVEGEIVISDTRQTIAQRFTQSVSLARGARRQLSLYVPSLGENFEVQLVAQAGTIASVTPVVRQLSPSDRLVLIASDPPDAYNFIGDVRSASGSTSALALMRLDQFPDRTAALDAADVIVLSSVDTAALTRAQRDAIVQWVAAGGHLILSGGPNAQLVLGGFADVAPASAGQALVNATANELGALAAPAALTPNDAPPTTTLSVPRLQPAAPNVRTLAGSNETPLLLRRDYGRGLVDQLAFDPSLAPLRDWNGRAALFAWLMNGRVGQANEIGTLPEPLDAAYAAGALAAASPPSVWVVGGFFLLYVAVIGPVNFLLLKRTRKQTLAWLTIPAIVLGFTLLGLLTGFRLRGNNPQVHRMSVTVGDSTATQARGYDIFGLYSPRRADVDVDVNRGLAQVVSRPRDEDPPIANVDVVTGDPSRVRAMPLVNNDVRTVYTRDGAELGPLSTNLTFVPGSANTAAAISGDVRNDTGRSLRGCTLVVGKDYQAIGDLAAGASARVKLAMVVAHPQSLINLRAINNIRERYSGGRTFNYSSVVRQPRPNASSGAIVNSSGDRFPFEQNGPAVTDALVNWQQFTDSLQQDAEFGMTAAVLNSEAIGTGAYVSCWDTQDTTGARVNDADYTDRALRIWRVPVKSHVTAPGESLPPGIFTWNVVETTSSSELGDNGLAFEPGTHVIALTPWFDLRSGGQTPLVALNLVFNNSNSSPVGLGDTSIWLFDWKTQKYVKVIDAADEMAAQNAVAGPFLSPTGQIYMRLESRSESITLYSLGTTVEMGK